MNYMGAAQEKKLRTLRKGMLDELKAKKASAVKSMEAEFGREFARLMAEGKEGDAGKFVEMMKKRTEQKKSGLAREIVKSNSEKLSNLLKPGKDPEPDPVVRAVSVLSESQMYEEGEVERAEKYLRENLTRQELSEMACLDDRTMLRAWVLLGGKMEEPMAKLERRCLTEATPGRKAEEGPEDARGLASINKEFALNRLIEFMERNELDSRANVREALLLAQKAGIEDSTTLNYAFKRLYTIATREHKELHKEFFPHRRGPSLNEWVEENFSTPEKIRSVLKKYNAKSRLEFFCFVPRAGRVYASNSTDREMVNAVLSELGERPGKKEGAPESMPAPDPVEIVKALLEMMEFSRMDAKKVLGKVIGFYNLEPVRADDAGWVQRLENATIEYICELEIKQEKEKRAERAAEKANREEEKRKKAEAAAERARKAGKRHALRKKKKAEKKKKAAKSIDIRGITAETRMVRKLAAEEGIKEAEVVEHLHAIVAGFKFLGEGIIGSGINRTLVEKNIRGAISDNSGKTRKILGLLEKRGVAVSVSKSGKRQVSLEPSPDKMSGTWEHLMRDFYSQRVQIIARGS
ncbi:hypothetical protein GF412_05110 [Candidatus Micrarchaeota archaeon]|nr:hypothetical protein [Candidatus Micrarchaeota archaeon]MBD3418333.1 hypothetical protein [Candidatus Micrarchaeota archaeon]